MWGTGMVAGCETLAGCVWGTGKVTECGGALADCKVAGCGVLADCNVAGCQTLADCKVGHWQGGWVWGTG
jgi:hypothetical protein